MRELEFLPDWYPKLRKSAQRLRLRVAVALLIATGLSVWTMLARHNIAEAEVSLDTLKAQLDQARGELQLLDIQTDLLRKLQAQSRIDARLGLPIEMSRMLAAVEACMPREMSLLEVTTDTETVAKPLSAVSADGPRVAPEALLQRSLRVKVQGVAPTDEQVTTFFAELNKLPLLDQVRMTYAKDLVADGHLMRQFEISFRINLDPPAEKPAAKP
jgi:Tfp pilus assembly protein PilN